MRLVTFFDEKINLKDIMEDDIILTNDNEYFIHNQYNKNVILVNLSLADEDPELSKSINKMFNKLPNDYLKYQNTFFSRVFRPIYSVILQLNSLINEKKIDELVLNGGSSHLFLTLNSAEGEGEKWWYKSSWLLNVVINEYFKEQVSINWLKKESKIKLLAINIVRENILYSKVILGKFILALYDMKNIKTQYNFSANKKPVISIVNLPLQFRHMRALLKDINKIDPVYIVPTRIKLEDETKVIRSAPLNLFSLVKLIFKEKNTLSKEKGYVNFFLVNKNIKIPQVSIRRGLRLLNFRFSYKVTELKQTVKKLNLPEKTDLVTNMTYGQEILECGELAKDLGLHHINFQYVAMSKMLFPNMDLADKYYLYARKTYNLYKNYSNSYKYYLPVKRTPELKNDHLNSHIKITIFSQPDLYTDRYLHFIKLFLDRINSENLKVKVIVKPHYRQDKMDKFIEILSDYPFVKLSNKEDNVEELILWSDINISMTSSVLFEALMLGKMALIVDLDGQNESFILNNDICFEEVNFVVHTIDEIITIAKEYPVYFEKYECRYKRFLKNNNIISNYEEIFMNA